MPNLYIAYLGGKLGKSRVGEDHEVVMVVASSKDEAKDKARFKWKGIKPAHVDFMIEVEIVDGYKIILEKTNQDQKALFIDDWNELNPDVI